MCAVYFTSKLFKQLSWGWIHLYVSVSHPYLCFWHTDLQTVAPDHNGITENTAIIAGVVAALVLLVALTLLAVYYINTHTTVAPPFDLMQVNDIKNIIYATTLTIILSDNSPLTDSWPFSNCRLSFIATHQQLLACHEVPQPGMSVRLRRSRAWRSWERRFHWGGAVLLSFPCFAAQSEEEAIKRQGHGQ